MGKAVRSLQTIEKIKVLAAVQISFDTFLSLYIIFLFQSLLK